MDNTTPPPAKVKSRKLPAFQFYPGDWRKDPGIQSLNYHDRGIWLEILLLMHESEERGVLILNGQPMPEDALARILGLDNQILRSTLTTLLTYGVASKREDGAIFNRRMVRDEEIRSIRIKAGSKGGNPILLNQKSTTQVNQIPTPSSSSSSSSSSSDNIYTPNLSDHLNGSGNGHKKPPKPKFDPEGKTKYLDWVYLSEDQYNRVRAYYEKRGLGKDIFEEAIRELDRWFSDNPKMRPKRTDDAKALMGWPLDAALKRKRELIYTNKAKENLL